MIDWTATLLPAAFNGLPFYVARGSIEAGHRVAKTLIPNGQHVLESFGPTARAFEVDAYLTGDFCLAQAAALLAAAEALHRGVLVLPDSGARQVRLTKAKRAFDKDKLGFVAVTLEATAEPDIVPGGLSVNALEAAIYAASAGVVASLGPFADAAFQLEGQPAPIRDSAILAAASAVGDVAGLAGAARLDPAAQAPVALALDIATAAALALPQDPAAFGEALGQAASALTTATDPANLLALVIAAGQPPTPPPPTTNAASAQLRQVNAEAGVTLTAAARAIMVAEACARRPLIDRPQAVETRALAAAVFDDALARTGRQGLDLARALSAMAGLVAELITRRAANLAPIITVEAPRRLPSLWWAWRLYADPGRADEMRTRARAPHPAAMPTRFDALAS